MLVEMFIFHHLTTQLNNPKLHFFLWLQYFLWAVINDNCITEVEDRKDDRQSRDNNLVDIIHFLHPILFRLIDSIYFGLVQKPCRFNDKDKERYKKTKHEPVIDEF